MKISFHVRRKLSELCKSYCDLLPYYEWPSDREYTDVVVFSPDPYIDGIRDILKANPVLADLAFKKFKPCSDHQGNCYRLLGLCHLHGLGTPVNIEKALKCFIDLQNARVAKHHQLGDWVYTENISNEFISCYLYKAAEEFVAGNSEWRRNFSKMVKYRLKQVNDDQIRLEQLLQFIEYLDSTDNKDLLDALFKFLLQDQIGNSWEARYSLEAKACQGSDIMGLLGVIWYLDIGHCINEESAEQGALDYLNWSAQAGSKPAQMFLNCYVHKCKSPDEQKKTHEASSQESKIATQQPKQSLDAEMRKFAMFDFFKNPTQKRLFPQTSLNLIAEYLGPR